MKLPFFVSSTHPWLLEFKSRGTANGNFISAPSVGHYRIPRSDDLRSCCGTGKKTLPAVFSFPHPGFTTRDPSEGPLGRRAIPLRFPALCRSSPVSGLQRARGATMQTCPRGILDTRKGERGGNERVSQHPPFRHVAPRLRPMGTNRRCQATAPGEEREGLFLRLSLHLTQTPHADPRCLENLVTGGRDPCSTRCSLLLCHALPRRG